MLNRRLWILFVVFVLGFVLLALRLAKLQLADARDWQSQLQKQLHHEYAMETYRGSIVDRQGRALAEDVPSDELAIDYRAMNLDDLWLTRQATDRMKESGEWAAIAGTEARNDRREEIKKQIAGQIDAIPAAIAQALSPYEHLPAAVVREQVLGRYSEKLEKIHELRQDLWIRKYNPDSKQASSTGESGADADENSLDALFRQLTVEDQYASHTLLADVPAAVALFFQEHAAEYPGLSVRDNAAHNRREYPFGTATAQVIGTLRSVDAGALAGHRFYMPDLLTGEDLVSAGDSGNQAGNLGGYLPGDQMGESGVERMAEDQLRGERGAALVNLDSAGSGSEATGEGQHIDPAPGKNVQLTLDGGLQQDIYAALLDPSKGLLKGEDGKQHFAAIVVLSMDGGIMSAISYPSYDPGAIDEQRGALIKDVWRNPLFDRAIGGNYSPGSTVKPLLASAALTEKVITPQETIVCNGHFFSSRPDIFKCDDVHGPISMVDAISKSCNVYFYTVGDRLGVPRLSEWYGNYGFGKKLGVGLAEAAGKIPQGTVRDADQARTDALLLGIGQGPIAVTPLQMANAYATLLRGGVVIPPRIFADTPAQKMQPFVISPEILATVRQGMEKCVTEGTAKEHFRNFRLKVAGKTGTAEKERGVFDDDGNAVMDPERPVNNADGTAKKNADGTPMLRQLVERHDDAWFIGYAPADHPQYIVAAVMEWGGFGGAHAVPMVREAFTQLEAHGYLPRVDVP